MIETDAIRSLSNQRICLCCLEGLLSLVVKTNFRPANRRRSSSCWCLVEANPDCWRSWLFHLVIEPDIHSASCRSPISNILFAYFNRCERPWCIKWYPGLKILFTELSLHFSDQPIESVFYQSKITRHSESINVALEDFLKLHHHTIFSLSIFVVGIGCFGKRVAKFAVRPTLCLAGCSYSNKRSIDSEVAILLEEHLKALQCLVENSYHCLEGQRSYLSKTEWKMFDVNCQLAVILLVLLHFDIKYLHE